MPLLKNFLSNAKHALGFGEHDNSRLMELLVAHGRTHDPKDADRVYEELLQKRAILLLPSVNDGHQELGWRTIAAGEKLKLTSVFDVDGLKVLGAFTDEQALFQWAKRPTTYTAMPAHSVLEMCETEGIGRLVINSDQSTMFVLHGPGERFTTRTVQEATQVQIGTPARPLNDRILDKMRTRFQQLSIVKEAFHYAQTMKGEHALMIGLKIDPSNENSRQAALQAIHTALQGEKLDQTLDVFVIATDDWHKSLMQIDKALFFKRTEG